MPHLDNRIRQYMIEEIVGIFFVKNDAQHLIVVEMFPNERFEYDPEIEFTTSFVC